MERPIVFKQRLVNESCRNGTKLPSNIPKCMIWDSFQTAIHCKQTEIFKKLIERYGFPKDPKNLLLSFSIFHGNDETIRILSEKSSWLKRCPIYKGIPVILARKAKRKNIVKLFLEKEADFNVSEFSNLQKYFLKRKADF